LPTIGFLGGATTWASCAGRCARSADRVSSTGAPASASMNASRSGG
jgi:hypothetical protein